MPITQVDIDQAQTFIDELFNDPGKAEEYSQNPEKYVQDNGYENLNPQAVAECGVSYGGGGGGAAATTAGGAASSGVAGIVAAADPAVYNHYYNVDNSITNNIENHGNLDFDQTVQQGDGNVAINAEDAQGDVDIDNIQTGDGILVDGDVDNSNLASGDDNQQAIDQSTNITEVPEEAPPEAPPEEAPPEEIPPFG